MAKQLKTSADNRMCMFPDCKQILSIYNHAEYCHVHRDRMADKQKTKTAYYHFSGTK